MADPKAPKGGYKVGEWYDARQAWKDSGGNWTFSQPGQINPLSNQQGAGQQVSKEVVQQTAPENWGYIQKQRQQAQSTPSSPTQPRSKEEVTPFLNNFQKDLFESTQAPETKTPTSIPTTAELKTELAPTTELPDVLDRPAQFEQLRTQYGVSDLETQLTDLKAQEDELYAEFREQSTAQRGQGVALNVVQGRIGEFERQYLERKDYLGRQMSRVTDELNTKYSLVNQLMSFNSLDYNDAVERYQVEFGNNLKIYDLVADARKEERSEYEYDRDAAKANLQVLMGAITSGNLNYASASTDQKLMITKLEAQAGFPLGTMSNLQMAPSDRILSFSSDKSQAIMFDENGNFKTVPTGVTPDVKAGLTSTTNSLKSYIAEKKSLEEVFAKFGDSISPNTIYKTYNELSPFGPAEESSEELKSKYNITQSSSVSVSSANINKAKQIVIRMGGTEEDQKRTETDPGFVNWLIANE